MAALGPTGRTQELAPAPSYPPSRSQEISLPSAYWSPLSQEDKAEFIKLRAQFHQGQKSSSKDRRIVTFRKELLVVLKYLERGMEYMDNRSILVGVCFSGPFVCVNTRQLKSFLCRCKSSINGSFQQMGFVALRTKSKARSIVVSVLPSLENDQTLLRQWTVRCASDEAQFCFLSSFPTTNLPQITDEDLYEDKKGSITTTTVTTSRPYQQIQPVAPKEDDFIPPPISFSPKRIEFDLPAMSDVGSPYDSPRPDLSTSFSVDCFQSFVDDFPSTTTTNAEQNPMQQPSNPPIRRSFSANFSLREAADLSDDFDFQ